MLTRIVVLAMCSSACSATSQLSDGRPLVGDGAEPRDTPVASPVGWLVWASSRTGQHEIHLRRLAPLESPETAATRQLTDGGGTQPRWSPDGRWVAYYRESDHSARLIRPDGTADRELAKGVPLFWMYDGSGLVCSESAEFFGSEDNRFFRVDPTTGDTETVVHKDDFSHLAGQSNAGLLPGGITADGRWLVGWVYGLFRDGHEADNGSFKSGHAAVALDLLDPDALFFIGPGCATATPPAGPWVYHVSRQGPTMPDVFRLRIDDLADRGSYEAELANPDAEWGHEYMPRIGNGGRWMVYAASTGCHNFITCDYEIFSHRLGGGLQQRMRLTHDPANDSYPDLFVGLLPD